MVGVRGSVGALSVLSCFQRPAEVVGFWVAMMLPRPPLLEAREVVGRGLPRYTRCRSLSSLVTRRRPDPALSDVRESGLVPGRSAKIVDWPFPS